MGARKQKNIVEDAGLLFDLDGTIDSVYQHLLAWRETLQRGGIELAVWCIQRRIGMSGRLFVNALLPETGRRPVTQQQAEKFQKFHSEAYLKQVQQFSRCRAPRNS